MLLAKQIHKQSFKGESSKEAYLRACKWVATNIVSKEVELSDVFWRIEKAPEVPSELPTVDLILFTTINESEDNKRFCDICKEFHKSFFINENFNCDRCNKESYRSRIRKRLESKSTFKKERLHYILKKDK